MEATAPVELITDETGQHYGAILTTDARDHSLAAYTALAQAGAPVADSFKANVGALPIWMQNKLGACVGHAAGKARQSMTYLETGGTIVPFSARFLYAMSKCLDGMPNIEGTDPRVTAKVMKGFGTATEATMPNDTTLDHATYTYGGKLENIPIAALAEAANDKSQISNFAFADITEHGIKAAIQFAYEHKGAVFMLSEIDKAWWTAPNGVSSWAAKDIFPLRPPSDMATLGGHETMPYGFDTVNGRTILIGRNSWSDQWGIGTQYGENGDYWLYLDEWLPHIRQVIVVFDIETDYSSLGFSYQFAHSLKLGMQNSDVVALQHALRIDGEFTYPSLTGYFGSVTLQAVKAFQAKYAADILTPVGLTQPTGFVGASTIKKLNALFAPKG